MTGAGVPRQCGSSGRARRYPWTPHVYPHVKRHGTNCPTRCTTNMIRTFSNAASTASGTGSAISSCGAAGAAPGGPLGLVVVVLAVVGLAAALWWRLGTPRRTARSPETLFGSTARGAADHRAAASAHAEAQRWTEAVQERMRALVRALEDRAVLDPRPGRTADEAAAEAMRLIAGARRPAPRSGPRLRRRRVRRPIRRRGDVSGPLHARRGP